jgi:hypothetical protein
MTKSEKNELRRLRAVQLLLKRNSSVYSGYLGLERMAEKLDLLIDELDAVQVLQTKGSVPTTVEKNQYRSQLQKLMLSACSHLHQVADDLDLDGLREFSTVTRTDLRLLKAEELVSKGTVLLSELEHYEVSLEETGFMLDDRGTLSDALDRFRDWMQSPRETIELRKVGTTSVPALLLMGRRMVRQQLEGFMLRYEDSHPRFYSEYLEARRLKRVAVSHEESAGDVAAAA